METSSYPASHKSQILDHKIKTRNSSLEFETSSLCPHFGVCGGCSRQNLSYAEQLTRKENYVRSQFSDLTVGEFHPIVASPEQTYYRNKMEYSFGDQRDLNILSSQGRGIQSHSLVHLGLHPKKSFGLVVPTPECFLLSADAQKILQIVSDWASENQIPVYLRKDNSGILRHLVIREGKNTGERMVNLITTSALRDLKGLDCRLKESEINITTFIWTHHDGLSDVARGDSSMVIWGPGTIQEKIGDVTIQVSPRTFMQTNTHAAELLINYLKESVGVGDTLLDLYCGTGALGLNLAGQFIQVKGVEVEAASVESARETAQRNGIINFTAQQGQVEKLLGIFEENRGRIDAVIVDPPRAGLHPKVVKALDDSLAPLIIYVSCNPESLVKDLKGLSETYSIESVQPMDFFPHTDHVETVVRLKKI